MKSLPCRRRTGHHEAPLIIIPQVDPRVGSNSSKFRWMMLRHPYRVVEVWKERGRSWTLALEPAGHSGMIFRAGQFAWLALSLQQHRFSFSSSALNPRRLEFTIKELSDYTSAIGTVHSGIQAYLEGPFGAFNLDTESFSSAVFIVGEIGITQ